MEGQEVMVRSYGLREIGSGMMTLSVDKEVGLASRIAGDGLDIVALGSALHSDNPKRDNVAIALVMVAGVTLLDLLAMGATTGRHTRHRGDIRDFGDRSGFSEGHPCVARAGAGEGQGAGWVSEWLSRSPWVAPFERTQ